MNDPTKLIAYLAEVERNLREYSPTIVETCPDGIVVIDWQGVICLVNARTELIFGYDRTEMRGQRVEMLLPVTLKDVHEGHRQNYFHNPRVREMGAELNLKALSKEGEEFPVKIMLSPFVTPVGRFVTAYIRKIENIGKF